MQNKTVGKLNDSKLNQSNQIVLQQVCMPNSYYFKQNKQYIYTEQTDIIHKSSIEFTWVK